MLSILIALAGCALVMIMLLWRSKREDPNDEQATDETSERIIYMKDYQPIWRKKVK